MNETFAKGKSPIPLQAGFYAYEHLSNGIIGRHTAIFPGEIQQEQLRQISSELLFNPVCIFDCKPT